MFSEDFEEIKSNYPTARWVLVTLTVPNCPIGDLRSTLGAMSKAWQRLIQRKEIADNMLGFVRSTEVTKEEKRNGYAHPHYHALILMKSAYFSRGYIKQARWTELWMQAMRSDEVVNVKVSNIDKEKKLYSILIDFKDCEMDDLYKDMEFIEIKSKQIKELRFINFGGVLGNSFKGLTNK